MVEIYTSEIRDPMCSALWEHYFSFLPEREQIKNKRYLRWQDKHAHLFGRLLLQRALIKFGFNHDILNQLQFNDHNKPFIDDTINFNISHSGKYIACVISTEIKLGIDLEQKIVQVNPDDFKEVFSQAEWECLKTVEGKLDLFYKLWTRKECVIKANGSGLAIPLDKVDVLSESVMLEGQTWFIADLDLDSNYSASLATSCKSYPLSFTPVNLYT